MKNFMLYGREECHLCEAMKLELEILQKKHDFSVEWVDVDQDAELDLKYGFYVPVLMYEGRKVCNYHFEREAFLQLLA